MHPLLMIDGAIRRARRYADRVCVPVTDWRIRQRLERDPGMLDSEIEQAISRGIRYFEPLPGLEITTMIALWPAFQSGLEPRLRFLVPALQYYRARFNNPDIRLLDKDYDPSSSAVADLLYVPPNHVINILMEKCLYADRMGIGAEILDDLARLEDGGFYGTTHIVWGCLLLKRFSGIDKNRIDALLDRGIGSMKRRQRIDAVGDLFAERVAFLQWAERHDDVDASWIWRLVRAQRPDGGWSRLRSIWPQPASQHTSCLALAALIQFRARLRPGPFGGGQAA